MSTVDVIIPTYNRRDLAARAAGTLLRQTRPPDRVIVVDDASCDGTADFLRQALPWVETLRRPTNGGFAAAVSTGLRASSADYVALLNNDALPEPGWLEALVAAAEGDASLGSCASKIVFMDQPDRVNSAGIFVRPSGSARDIGYGEPDGPRFQQDREVIGASGGAMLLSRAALDSVGLFDEDLVAYHEDVDWALRAQLAGFRCRYVAAARVCHAAHATYGTGHPRAVYLQCRNLPLVPIKVFPRQLLLEAWPYILAVQAYQIARFARAGLGAPAIRGKLDAVRLAPRFWRKRATVRGLESDPEGFIRRLKALSS